MIVAFTIIFFLGTLWAWLQAHSEYFKQKTKSRQKGEQVPRSVIKEYKSAKSAAPVVGLGFAVLLLGGYYGISAMLGTWGEPKLQKQPVEVRDLYTKQVMEKPNTRGVATTQR